jgi:Protein of unknown function (DUF998)
MSTLARVPGELAAPACDPATRVTRALLGYGVLAGPVYVVVALAQALIRPGFDLTRDDVSLLANGSLGWIQVADFLVTGVMVIAFAVGLGRALDAGRTARWAARLLAGYGVGLVGAGIFVADPMRGFPPGAPAGMPASLTAHGLLHIVFAGIGFLCFVGACLLLARRFAVAHRRGWAVASAVTGVVFLAAFAGVASGSDSQAVVLAFWAVLLVAWGYLGALAVHLYGDVSARAGEPR